MARAQDKGQRVEGRMQCTATAREGQRPARNIDWPRDTTNPRHGTQKGRRNRWHLSHFPRKHRNIPGCPTAHLGQTHCGLSQPFHFKQRLAWAICHRADPSTLAFCERIQYHLPGVCNLGVCMVQSGRRVYGEDRSISWVRY